MPYSSPNGENSYTIFASISSTKLSLQTGLPFYLLVFSFFLPQYAPPGNFKDAQLTSPESQVLNTPKIIQFANGVISLVDIGKQHVLKFQIIQNQVNLF